MFSAQLVPKGTISIYAVAHRMGLSVVDLETRAVYSC